MPWFIALFLVVVAGAIAMYVRSRENRIRKAAALKQEMTELEMQALRAQMNPHFIFNCINSIDALVQGNDKYLATQYLNKFARLIRNVLDSSRQNLVPLAKDVETLRLYIDLEKFRHEGQFEVDLEVDPELLRGDYKVPPLVIQPFVENAILHGLRHRREPGGRLVIRIDTTDGRLRYVVQDNGVGRQATMGSSVGERTSYGTRMSLDRIRLFNEEEAPSVTITDLRMNGQPAGTRVEVFLRMR
jgi:sensor histidine kinase YesM